MIFETYEDFVNYYVKGDSDALFVMACLDFSYQCKLMAYGCSVQVVSIVTKHAYKVAKFAAEAMANTEAAELVKRIELFSRKLNKSVYQKTTKWVDSALDRHININTFKLHLFSKYTEQMKEFENSVGIDCMEYYEAQKYIQREYSQNCMFSQE